MSEFDIIRQYFSALGGGDGVVLSVGDDAAALQVPSGESLLVSTDTLVDGRHFTVAICLQGALLSPLHR